MGRPFLHFKDPERLPDSLSEILRLIINLLSHSCGCETSAEAPRGWRCELGGDRSVRLQLVGLTFIEGTIVETVTAEKRRVKIYHRCILLHKYRLSSVSGGFIHNKKRHDLNVSFNNSLTQMSSSCRKTEQLPRTCDVRYSQSSQKSLLHYPQCNPTIWFCYVVLEPSASSRV